MPTTTLWLNFIAVAAACIVFTAAVIYVTRRSLEKGEGIHKQSYNNSSSLMPASAELKYSILLCVMIGNGVELILQDAFLVFLIVMTESQAGWIMTIKILYLILSIVADYIAVRILASLKPDIISSTEWIKASLATACWPVAILSAMNGLLSASKCTMSTPLHTPSPLISIPVTVLRGYLGSRTKPIQLPIFISRRISMKSRNNYRAFICVLVVGFITSYIGTFQSLDIAISKWSSRAEFGICLGACTLLLCTALIMWITLLHILPASEELQWWCWKSFIAYGGLAGLWVLINAMIFSATQVSSSPALLACASVSSLFISLPYSLAMGNFGLLFTSVFLLMGTQNV